jgi:glycosyltransferase involved in cell wall biosynthesis
LKLVGAKVVEFFPPVDLTEFAPSLGGPGSAARGPLLVGTVGNLNPHKGHDILWAACSELWSRGHDFRVRICGHPSPSYQERYDAALREWTASLEPAWRSRVEYIHPDGSVAPYLQDLDIFVLPSRSEGVPTALLEAMGVGLPVVSFDIGGVGEVVENGVDGLIAGAPNADNLVAALAPLLGNEGVRRAMGSAARQAAEAKFSAERCAEKHLQAIRIALGQTNP